MPQSSSTVAPLSRRQKAAIIVRLMLSQGANLSLAHLPHAVQRGFVRQIAEMRPVDKDTMNAVIAEFLAEIDNIGLSFPDGIQGALGALEGRINPDAVYDLRQQAGVGNGHDNWKHIAALDADTILPVLERESIEVGAVLLSKLNVATAAALLGRLPGERARRITYAISLTEAVTPDAVQRIGESLFAQLDDRQISAFDEGPEKRVGDILNYSLAATRDDVLAGLAEKDADFADRVKKAIFTFANISDRIDPRNIPKITRAIDPEQLKMALAAAATSGGANSADFILDNMSKRLAEQLRQEMQDIGTVKKSAGEDAMNAVVNSIREMEAAGDIMFVTEDD